MSYDRLPRMALALLLLMDDRKCFREVRRMRWPDGVRCLACGSSRVAKRGFDIAIRTVVYWLSDYSLDLPETQDEPSH